MGTLINLVLKEIQFFERQLCYFLHSSISFFHLAYTNIFSLLFWLFYQLTIGAAMFPALVVSHGY